MRISDWSSDVCSSDLLSLAMRSDLTLAEQVAASGATWLDRELIASEPVAAGTGFGLEIREAMEARSLHLEGAGLAQRRGTGFLFASDLITTPKGTETSQEIEDRKSTRLNSSHKCACRMTTS